jgi:signal transduction histidine kinase
MQQRQAAVPAPSGHRRIDVIDDAGTPGVGIRGMRERIRQLGGVLEIASNNNGTVILARLPAIENSSTEKVLPIPDTSTAAA